MNMDFLDPRAKKQRTIRLMVGYVLVAILIFTSSTILVFHAYGFDVDRKTGQVIQNGLVYIDSVPGNASIFINGERQKNQTNARLTLPEGRYDLLLQKEGYRDWRRTFDLRGGSIQRLTYPLLLLNHIEEKEVTSYTGTKQLFATESLDHRWLLTSQPAAVNQFTEYDLNNINNAFMPAQRSIVFPAGLFTESLGDNSIELVEWSADNKHVLIKHTFPSGNEFIILSKDDPLSSVNINLLLGLSPTTVVLRDKKFDQWYIYDQPGGLLQTADAKKLIVNVLSSITAFKTHDSSVILYAQTNLDGTQNIFFRQNGLSTLVRQVSAGPVKLEVARFDSAWYAVVGSDGDKKTYIFKDPQKIQSKLADLKPTPATIVHQTNALNEISFSSNTRFVMAHSGQHVGVYDAEKNETYEYDLTDQVDADSPVVWMDGHRLIYHSMATIVIMDFDGSNKQKLIATLPANNVFFDRNYTVLYTLTKSKTLQDTLSLIHADLRFEQDK